MATEEERYPIGALTTEQRDTWSDAREILLKADSQNPKALERIESAIIVVALDDAKPITREEMSRGLWVGDGKSRFFDKHQRESCYNGFVSSKLRVVTINSHRLRQWKIWIQRGAFVHGRNANIAAERLASQVHCC